MLSGIAKLNFFLKSSPRGLLVLDVVPKSMFESLLGKRKAIGALSENVDRNFGMPFIDRHYMVPNGPNEGCILTVPPLVPNTSPA